RRSMALYAFGSDGHGDPVSEVHALRRSNRLNFGWLPGLAREPFLFYGRQNSRLRVWNARGYARDRANRAALYASHNIGYADGITQNHSPMCLRCSDDLGRHAWLPPRR